MNLKWWDKYADHLEELYSFSTTALYASEESTDTP